MAVKRQREAGPGLDLKSRMAASMATTDEGGTNFRSLTFAGKLENLVYLRTSPVGVRRVGKNKRTNKNKEQQQQQE